MFGMLTVLCVYQPSKVYNPDYVLNLQAAVKRHLPVEHRFVCMTKQAVPGVDCIQLEYDFPGWWSKMEMFRPGLPYERILYIDLDTVITGDISDIASYTGVAGITEDFIHGGPSQSILNFHTGTFGHVWDEFIRDPDFWMYEGDRMIPPNFGDQTMMTEVVHPFEFDYWQDLHPGQIISYRLDCKKSNVIDELPEDARMISFHGREKPHKTHGWIQDHWNRKEKAHA